ncbi:hypothetical protein AN641_02135 [Candidatus Epulonipiscioides gigas]|nr:hypothetical protein AN641_02135 [Epulopiscium sp. SCG-C07WGA-EpuloA2]
MDLITNLLLNLIGIGVGIVTIVIKLMFAFVGAFFVAYKRKNFLSFIITFVIIYMYPFLILLTLFIPHKIFKLRLEIRQDSAFIGKNSFIASAFALSGIVAKFDGKVTKEEIRKTKNYLGDFFGLSEAEITQYQDAFNFGKNNQEEYIEFASFIRNNYNSLVRNQVLFMLLLIALDEDKNISTQMDQFLIKIANVLGISPYEYTFLKAQLTGQYNGATTAPSTENLIKKYSEILGVSEDASFTEIKKAYRKLAKEYHPDKYRDKPKSYIEMAQNKMSEINVAYEYLEKLKGKEN